MMMWITPALFIGIIIVLLLLYAIGVYRLDRSDDG